MNKIGLTTKKSKTIEEIKVPKKYFFDFLRGHFDGDGSFYSYWDPRWKTSFMFYTAFVSASKLHIFWPQQSVYDLLGIRGHITKAANHACYQLKYAKAESLVLLKKIYYSNKNLRLTRKYLKIIKTLAIMKKNYARVAKR
ncbi:hypothetical protein KKA13_03765 [Patescibacteria group bacterium]|nr:hypothetical protein [Patescibacteria group bacterium]